MLTAGRLWRMSSSLAAVNLSFSFRTPSPHDSLALKKNRDTWRLQAHDSALSSAKRFKRSWRPDLLRPWRRDGLDDT